MSTENSTTGLTEEDYKKIEEITKYGTKAFRAKYDSDEKPEPPTQDRLPQCGSTDTHSGDPCKVPVPEETPDALCYHHDPDSDRFSPTYRSQGDGRMDALAVDHCNAIRAAAEDGKTYREIASLFAFLSNPKTAHEHATGECSHDEGLPPVESKRDPGPQQGRITGEECEALRERCRDGWFFSWNEASEYLDAASHTTPRRHLLGECSHDAPDLSPPEFGDGEIRHRREAAGWSQRELADRLGVSHTAVTGWETGKRSVRFCVAFAVDAVLPDSDGGSE